MRYPDCKNKNSIQDGLEFQDFVMETLAKQHGIIIQVFGSRKYQFSHGESVQRYEIKLDRRCTETGRLSIEIAEKTSSEADWVQSGIYAGNSLFYVQGNYSCFWLFMTKFLVKLHKAKNKDYEEKEETTIKAFYLPLKDADKYGLKFMPGKETAA